MNKLQQFAAKALGIKYLPQTMIENRLLRRTRIDYRKEVGDLIDSSVVTAPVHWVQRSFPEAVLTVRRQKPDGSYDYMPNHPALALIQRPNPHYGDLALWAGTVFSYLTAGNAYWIKLRKGTHLPGQLWYVPHWTMTPKDSDDGSAFISHYEYRPGAGMGVIRYAPEDIVHFRHGIDPRNPRLGLSPLDGVIREIFMDLESSNFVASLLKNSGVPGMVVSPKTGGTVPAEDVAATKAWLRQAFTGDRRGEPLVMGAPTDVVPYGFNPQQMNMSDARDIAEERVCAALGIPAAIVGFGAGLQSTKVGATMEELRKLAWQNGVMPVARVFADELDRSLIPDFGERHAGRSHWDTSEVQALQDDRAKAATTWNTMINGGWAEVAEGREGMGLEVDDSHRVFLRPAMALEVPSGSKGVAHWAEKALEWFSRQGVDVKARAGRQQRDAGRAFVIAVQRQEEPLAKAMNGRLKRFFADLGRMAKAEALPILKDNYLPPPKGAPAVEEKSDDLLVQMILERLGLDVHRTTFSGLFEAHFMDVAKAVSEASGLAGISGSLPDPVARTIAAAGGRRAGLIDIGKQSRSALFDAIALGRSEGEGAQALANRIAQHIEAGPWTTIEQRALTIARTETKYAQNVSTIERAKAAGVAQFIVFDGRFGPGRSKPDHIARDGSIVTAQEADRMAAAEHPNGTLSFAPYFGED
ncbi:phage portal protein [Devosia sp.]|uniref:phage portal protein n=1 Tax=Devosia sp. TaxID=1871048 RepID=UPI001AC5B125|nr:phage portal protein [Devosia sp.]MBN9333872.1 phage portal protein [Devosia sp.]